MYRPYRQPDFMPSREEMIALMRDKLRFSPPSETVPISDALHRVCAGDVLSKNTLPNRPISQMDGIAVRFSDFADGLPDTGAWTEGEQYHFGNTGVALPDGFDTVVMIEQVEFTNGRLTILRAPAEKGENVGQVGGYMRVGEKLAHRGLKLRPAHLSLLASGGHTEVEVLKKPKVAVIPTGDELVPPGAPVPPGRNVESNSLMLSGFLRQWGAEPVVYPIVPDDQALLRAAIREAVDASDMVVLNAGSSKGSKDFSLDVLETMGEVLVYELAHGPGKHSSLALVDGKPLLGIAGPPPGAEIAATLYLRTPVDIYLLQPDTAFDRLDAALTQGIGGYKVDFCMRMRVFIRDGRYMAEPVSKFHTRAEGVAMVSGHIYLHAGERYAAGDTVPVELWVPREYIV